MKFTVLLIVMTLFMLGGKNIALGNNAPKLPNNQTIFCQVPSSLEMNLGVIRADELADKAFRPLPFRVECIRELDRIFADDFVVSRVMYPAYCFQVTPSVVLSSEHDPNQKIEFMLYLSNPLPIHSTGYGFTKMRGGVISEGLGDWREYSLGSDRTVIGFDLGISFSQKSGKLTQGRYYGSIPFEFSQGSLGAHGVESMTAEAGGAVCPAFFEHKVTTGMLEVTALVKGGCSVKTKNIVFPQTMTVKQRLVARHGGIIIQCDEGIHYDIMLNDGMNPCQGAGCLTKRRMANPKQSYVHYELYEDQAYLKKWQGKFREKAIGGEREYPVYAIVPAHEKQAVSAIYEDNILLTVTWD